ncbi:MAG: hypothetical protein IT305_14555 [Chloroflexi bacterium]|nr:hypothetical protein [Chloroflexota bacterium]
MPSREAEYDLIAALHDQLEDIESYDRYLKDAKGCEDCSRIWERLRAQANEAVSTIRAELQRHAAR